MDLLPAEYEKGPWGSLVSLPASGVGDPGANPGGPIYLGIRSTHREQVALVTSSLMNCSNPGGSIY